MGRAQNFLLWGNILLVLKMRPGITGFCALSARGDSNGTILAEGDSVHVIKDLKVKGTSTTLKRGTLVKNIHLTDDPEEIECRVEAIKGLVLKTCFLKKA